MQAEGSACAEAVEATRATKVAARIVNFMIEGRVCVGVR